MRFRQNAAAEAMYAQMLQGHPGMRVYTCRAGYWNFVITFDLLHNTWAASYKPMHGQGAGEQAKQCDEPRPERGEKHRQYDSQREAELACERKYKQLRAEH